MNSCTPAATGRAGAGFRDTKAGAGSIFRAALNHSKLWLLVRFLPLVVLTCGSVGPAHANGVSTTIANGQTVTGTVTSAGSDVYSFTMTAGASFDVAISETGFHDPSFFPTISITGPGGIGKSEIGRPLYARLEQLDAPAGPWTVKVSRGQAGGDSGGTYALTLVQVPAAAGGTLGSAIFIGGSTSGSINRGGVEVRTFKGLAGHKATLTVDGGVDGLYPDITVFTPTGGLAGGFGCATSCFQDIPLTADGVYTVLISKSDRNDVTGDYTLSVK